MSEPFELSPDGLVTLVRARIVAAAIHDGLLGVTLSMSRPARHHHILNNLARAGMSPMGLRAQQGFLTSDGKFVDRYLAFDIAKASGQLRTPEATPGPQLFSEDVW